jgi:hypothetical protein
MIAKLCGTHGSSRYTTFVVRLTLLPLTWDGGHAEAYPVMLVNPRRDSIRSPASS